ncbi:ribose-phosphate pyrophosphokinase [Anaerolineales bacterium HSG6]|nr:ribose-phosphate pyrophosphokinase [Anaerolineales bacterium HSG6]MDM8530564.1 ribose-phosphate pyrophosphokinase [Anaerolineales bacterium HSG25]
MYGEIALFSGTANPKLAQEISHSLGVPLAKADVFKFSNNNIFCRLHQSVRSKDVFIIQPIAVSYDEQGRMSSANDNLMELLIMIDTVKRDSGGRITAVVPYYGYGRTDKKDQPRVPITARLVADLVSTAGADRFLTIDLHAGQIQGFFNIPVDEVTAFYLLSDHMRAKKIENGVVVAGDIGATKRARNFAQALDMPLAIIEKRRIQRKDGSDAEALNVIGDVAGKDCIIYDDEIDTAGTMVQAVHFLKGSEAADIYACASHSVFSDPAVKRLTESPIREVAVTNTIALPPEKTFDKLTILSVAPLLGEVIRRVHLGISVGELFNE